MSKMNCISQYNNCIFQRPYPKSELESVFRIVP